MPIPDVAQLTLLSFEAVRTGDAETLRRALAAGVLVDVTTARGDTLLTLACRHGHVEAARVLLDHGADPASRDATGASALDIARSVGAADVVALLTAS